MTTGRPLAFAISPEKMRELIEDQIPDDAMDDDLVSLDEAVSTLAQKYKAYQDLVKEACDLRTRMDESIDELRAADRMMTRASLVNEFGKDVDEIDHSHDYGSDPHTAPEPDSDDTPSHGGSSYGLGTYL